MSNGESPPGKGNPIYLFNAIGVLVLAFGVAFILRSFPDAREDFQDALKEMIENHGGSPEPRAPVEGPGCSCKVPKLSGMVDDCCCNYETVDSINVEVLNPILNKLVATPFFRFFKVRLWCDCPFWPDDGMCHSRDCSVGECPAHEVPGPLRGEMADTGAEKLQEKEGGAVLGSDENAGQGAVSAGGEEGTEEGVVDRTLDAGAFRAWKEEDNPWTADVETDNAEMSYVNLALNPERYTGYKGESARRIWSAIYMESCFKDGPNDTCTERRVFFRLISGFHMSITVHVATNFIHDKQTGEWGPHLTMFRERVANFPDRLQNLYFTFLFVLRAATKAADNLSELDYSTGNSEEDLQTLALMKELVHNQRLRAACPVPFDEAQLWKGDEGPQLMTALQGHFRNISKIMDCVGCERCRLWGKLEMLGLATALKILFSVENGAPIQDLSLQRNEVTALVNTLWRFSEALKSTAKLMQILSEEDSRSFPEESLNIKQIS